MNANIAERLLAAGDPDSIAYVDSTGQITRAELGRAARAYAARLTEMEPGSTALVVADDSIETVTAILGIWWRGGVPVPVSPMLTADEIAFIERDCAAAYVHKDTDHRYTDHKGANHDDVVLIQYTSGSTGRPKGVLHTRQGLEAVLNGFGRLLGLTPDDTVLSTAKLSFGYGFGNSLLFPLAGGARTVLCAGPPDVYRVAAAAAAHRPTVLCSVPRVYAAILDRVRQGDPPDLGSLRVAVSAGEHLPAPMCEAFTEAYGVPLVNGLGATEVLHIVVATPGSRPGSTGVAVPGMRISVRDDAGEVVPDGVEGRLHVAGPSVAAGYLDRPDETARTFADGGAYTGDIVRRAVSSDTKASGHIEYVCRRDDLINVGGFKVSPFEVEAAVRDVPGIAQCAVVGNRDHSGLEQAVAYVVPADGVDRLALRAAARQAFRTRLPAFKRPAAIEVVDRLPVTSTGKLARYKLRGSDVSALQKPQNIRAPLRSATHAAHVDLRVLRDGPGRTVVCIPYAGGSAGSFTRLARHLPESWRIVAGEAGHRGATLDDVADAWWKAITPCLSAGTVLFGHSLGALIAAEVASRAGGELERGHVVLSAPPLTKNATAPLPPSSLTKEEIDRLVLPRLRRDVALVPDDWTVELDMPVHVLLGTEDPLCTVDAVVAHLTADVHVVDGDHYFVMTNAPGTAAVLRQLYA